MTVYTTHPVLWDTVPDVHGDFFTPQTQFNPMLPLPVVVMCDCFPDCPTVGLLLTWEPDNKGVKATFTLDDDRYAQLYAVVWSSDRDYVASGAVTQWTLAGLVLTPNPVDSRIEKPQPV